MSDVTTDARAEVPALQALVSPVEALRRGFEFEGQEAAGTALAAAYKAAASAQDQGAGIEVLPREGFRIGHLGLMIRYEDGSELSDLPPVYRLPNAPEWFTGVAHLHGLLVPVFDLAIYLGIEHQEGSKPMLLVLGHGAGAAGVIVDNLPVRLRVKASERAEGAPVPSGLDGCVRQTYWAEERTWMDLQADALLSKLGDELASMGQ